MRRALALLLAGLLIGVYDASEAQTLRLNFTATVSISDSSDSMPPVGAGVSGGVLFSQDGGVYAPHLPCGFQCGTYEFFAPYGIYLDLGTQQVGRQYFQMLVGDDWSLPGGTPKDEVQFGSSTADFTYVLVLRGATSTFSGVTVPGPEVLQSMLISSHLEVFSGADIMLFAPVTSLQVTAVPELPIVAYFVGGSLLLLGRRARVSEA